MEELDEKRKKRRKRKKSKRKKSSGKKDACYYKVKARYSVWPSAYASGALSKCRKVGAKNWGNKSKKRKTNEGIKLTEDLLKQMIREFLKEEKGDFKRHPMYDPETGKMVNANKLEDHENLAKKGYTHVNPKILIIVLKDEGGAAGMEPFVKATKASEKEIEKTVKTQDVTELVVEKKFSISENEIVIMPISIVNKLVAKHIKHNAIIFFFFSIYVIKI